MTTTQANTNRSHESEAAAAYTVLHTLRNRIENALADAGLQDDRKMPWTIDGQRVAGAHVVAKIVRKLFNEAMEDQAELSS
jgi:hypothetical protein